MQINRFFVIIIFVFFACSSTYKLKEGNFTIYELNKKLEGESAIIVMADREELKGKNISIDHSVTSWIELNSGELNHTDTKNLDKIIIKNHNKGALEGLGFGILAFFPLGAIGSIGAEEGSLQGAFVGLLAVLAGPIIGAVIGHKDVYIIKEVDDDQKMFSDQNVKLAVTSIQDNDKLFVTIIRGNKKVRLMRSDIKHIDKSGNQIYITISKQVYESKFK